jgi:hypothetical protein
MIRAALIAACAVIAAISGSWRVDRARADPTAASEERDVQPDPALDDPPGSISQLSPEQIQRLLARYAAEPSALDVAKAALQSAERDPDRFASMLNRARWRGLVPSLALGARRGQGVDLRTVTEDDGIRFTSGDDLVLSATLRFELGRLLFADEEVAITREARAAHAAKLELVRSVIHLYFVRRRLQLERDALGHSSVSRELRILEIEAMLDSFTNGHFRRMISERKAAWTTEENTRVFEPP